jgi:hypothetical protein
MPRSIGRDLLDLPFAEMVRNLALAIAEGQTALDVNSLNTLRQLAEIEVPVVTEMTEILEAEVRNVSVNGTTIPVTGVRIRASGAPPLNMNMIQAGLLPTFYQFTEAAIEVRLSITMREVGESETEGEIDVGGPAFLALGRSRAFASSVDYRNANKYQYQAAGSSVLRATMRPVPPPSRLEPRFTTVDTFTSPPTVTRDTR